MRASNIVRSDGLLTISPVTSSLVVSTSTLFKEFYLEIKKKLQKLKMYIYFYFYLNFFII